VPRSAYETRKEAEEEAKQRQKGKEKAKKRIYKNALSAQNEAKNTPFSVRSSAFSVVSSEAKRSKIDHNT